MDMDLTGTKVMCLPIALLVGYLLFTLVKLFRKEWWTPVRIQSAMRSQGIKGPPRAFLNGNAKEIMNMLKDSFSKPMEDLNHHIFPRMQPHIYAWTKIYGKNYLQWFGPIAEFVTTQPELVKEILTNKEKAYRKPGPEGHIKKLIGDGLVHSEGKKWEKMRKLANHAFHAERLKGMNQAMIASVEMMLERWEKHLGKEIEVFQEFRLLTSEVISKTAFGSSYIEGQKIFEMMGQLAFIITRTAMRIRLPVLSWIMKSTDDTEADKIEKEIKDAILKIIEKREKESKGGADRFGNDFLGLLLKAYRDDGNDGYKVTTDDMIDECKTFFLSGHETTTNLLTWTILLLGMHTDWQEKAREEVLTLFGNRYPDSEGIAKMKTMSMILNESLRLYPPVEQISRRVKKEVKLGKFNLFANMKVIMSQLAIHHDAQLWGEDADRFRPERFSEGVAKATDNSALAFLPFGYGPRICVGMNFALTEAKIALAMILQRYRFTLSANYIHSPVTVLTIRAQHGVRVILNPL